MSSRPHFTHGEAHARTWGQGPIQKEWGPLPSLRPCPPVFWGPLPSELHFPSPTFCHTKLRIIINISIFSSKHKNSKETDTTTSEANYLNPTDGHPVSQTRKTHLLIHQQVFKSGYQTLNIYIIHEKWPTMVRYNVCLNLIKSFIRGQTDRITFPWDRENWVLFPDRLLATTPLLCCPRLRRDLCPSKKHEACFLYYACTTS